MNVSKKFCLLGFIFGFIICFGLFVSHNVSALEDISITFDSSSGTKYNGSQVFGSLLSSVQQAYDYSYLNVTFSPSREFTSNSTISPNIFGISFGCFSGYQVSPYFNYSYPITYVSGKSCNNVPVFISNVNFGSVLQSGETVTFTLSENSSFGSCSAPPSGSLTISSNGTFNVAQYASVDVNVPIGEDSRFMGVVIDSFWQYHVAFASACVGIIVIFLVYRIIRGRLR